MKKRNVSSKMSTKTNHALTINDIVERLQSLSRYDAEIAGGCECCGSWVEHLPSNSGDWVKVEHIQDLIEELSAIKDKNS